VTERNRKQNLSRHSTRHREPATRNRDCTTHRGTGDTAGYHPFPAPVAFKIQGIDDALIQPYIGHVTCQSLEIYSRLALTDAQQRYDDVIGDFPV
jgi:hypothetical protein